MILWKNSLDDFRNFFSKIMVGGNFKHKSNGYNIALVGKWLWRMLKADKGDLCFQRLQVLKKMYLKKKALAHYVKENGCQFLEWGNYSN